MFSFDFSTLQILSTVTVFLTIIIYFIQAIRHSVSQHVANRSDRYLRYREDGEIKPGQGITAYELRSTFMASAFSLASAIYVYVEWAATDGLLALWSPLSWACGVLVLVFLTRKIFAASRETWTLHSYLGNKYDSEKVVKISSLLTSLVFLLQVSAEVVVGIAVLKAFLGANVSLSFLSILVGGIFITYSLIGGLPSVLKTDFIQYRIIVIALFSMILIAVNDGGKTAFDNIYSSLGTFIPTGMSWIVILSLFALNLPLLFTDMSVWQRIAAATSVDEAKKGALKFFWSLLGWMSVIVLFGVAFGPFFTDNADIRPAIRMISFFSDSIVYPLIIAGFIGALISTADTFLISSVQTIVADWLYRPQLKSVNYDSSKLDSKIHVQMIKSSRAGILVFGIVAVIIGLLAWIHLGLLLELLFVIFGLQTSLAPSVLYALVGKVSGTQGNASFYSISMGGIVAILGFIISLFGVNLLGLPFALWTPILSLLVSFIVFHLFSKNQNN